MARNKVPLQKGLSEAQFATLYGTEDQCREAVMRWRWPSGFVCPVCGGQDHSLVKTRGLYQCTACRRQTSFVARTIFAATKVPLATWFRAMYHLTQSKGGISSLELGRRLGVTQTTAWEIKHKLMQVMMERDAAKRLTGRIEVDDAYLGGERNGGKRGRGSPAKTPIVAPQGKPIRLKLRRVKGFRRAEITALATRNFNPASTIVSDGLRCFAGVSNAGCIRQPITTGSGRQAALAGDTRPAGRCRCISTCCNFKSPSHKRKLLSRISTTRHDCWPGRDNDNTDHRRHAGAENRKANAETSRIPKKIWV